MGRRKFFIFLFLWFTSYIAWSQSDSLAGKQLRTVEIVGHPVARYAAGSRLQEIDSLFLKVYNASNLGEVLQYQTPIYLKSYGNNMLATAAFRGTSASQTAVLWHGFNINQPTLGQTDFSTIPATAFSQVTVQHGSAGANYGTGAIGGAILLSSPIIWNKGLKLRAQQDVGSFGHTFTNIGGGYSNQKISIQTSLFQQQARNDFEFVNFTKASKPTEKQANAATEQKGFTQDIHLKLNKTNTFSIRSWFTGNNNQSQPNMVQANSNARRRDENLRLMAEWNHAALLGISTFRIAYFRDFMHYQDDNTNSLTAINQYQAQAEHIVNIKHNLSLKFGSEFQHFSGEVSGYGKPVSENRGAAFGWLRYNPKPRLQLSLNVRQALVQGFNPPLTPTAGFNYYLLSNPASALIFKGNISRGYRVPTLNDRFWPTGNKNLKPENSWNYESGFQHTLKTNQLQVTSEVTLFHLVVDNYIQWIAGPMGTAWSPVNLKKVETNGVEFSTEASYKLPVARLTLGTTYGYTSAQLQKSYFDTGEPLQKQLIYVPKHTAKVYASLLHRNWVASSNLIFNSNRFTTPANTRWLPAFTLLNMAVGKTWQVSKYQLQVVGKVNNVANQAYQTYEYYAMPGRNYSLSVRFTFN
ncbi:TonB-dependent receptor plug domain-containing protein [Adhaeribacter aquaticus]|uniref:TonB-dependent receptor plug domain-containing protein n=1 Tax=Adhaeribacter aquaticus TaxID=299567 RepID=UPI0004133882|nr:TonB-dependent receptor [Adhaeribacter aquaticus]